MRVLVISDSHGANSVIGDAIETQNTADYVLFLGDGIRQFEDYSYLYPEKTFVAVRGNCDFFGREKLSETILAGNKRIFMTHGHSYYVKAGLDEAINAAKGQNADILLFGHTHVSYVGYENGLYIMNPGSIALPRRGKPSYGVIDITSAGIVPFIVEVRR
ncbi:MAG: hypothetical protein BGN88_02445 [Clostridiales bacterium 43-6]|nr:MAG: hypothetical protein BGN88_02445 [Clostridiales bacterium 43-6]